ncbi:MAG: serine/threonine-protein kinase [Cyanobacteria bacterium J06635_15]
MWQNGQSLLSGKYKIERQIGGGGFGLTYLAEQTAFNRSVVIKAPNPLVQADQDYTKYIRRFEREGQALAQITHPNVVQVIELFQEAGMPCLVMTYVKGQTLNERIRHQGKLPQDEAVSAFRQLAAALHRLHQAGLIHCDIHPGNIILQPDGAPVLIDFGSAKLLQPGTVTVTTTVNDSFAPYEQGNREGKPQPTLDVYGLSATLYFAVTGQKPQPATARKLYGDKLKAPKQQCSHLSDWLNQAILQGMALEAVDRPPSMQTLLGSLSPPQAKVRPSVSSNVKRKSRPAFPWRRIIPFIGGYLTLGLVFGLEGQALALAVTVALAVALAGIVALGIAMEAGVTRFKVVVVIVILVCVATLSAGLGAAWAVALAESMALSLATVVVAILAVAMAVLGTIAMAGFLNQIYQDQASNIFFILSASSIGSLAMGGGIIWWLQQLGLSLPR